MTKFFLPQQPGGKSKHIHQDKKKPSNCNDELVHQIFTLLKKLLGRQIQKTIRNIKEAGQKQQKKKKAQSQLLVLKGLSKIQLKRLAYQILTDELFVDEESIKVLTAKTPQLEHLELSLELTAFYSTIKSKPVFKSAIEDYQKVRNTINQKKQVKKTKSKLRKKSKLEIRSQMKNHHLKQLEEKKQEDNQMEVQQFGEEESEKPQFIAKVDNRQFKKEKMIQKRGSFQTAQKERTDFKKTGRNKVFQDKKDKFKQNANFRSKADPHSQQKSFNAQSIQKRVEQSVHPSWAAKRANRVQNFIQPFQGKKILL